MWGTHAEVTKSRMPPRFTPTHVGNTISSKYLSAAESVHPHACGEHAAIFDKFSQPFGSPPRMWGTLVSSHLFSGGGRFTPTHVGNTGASGLKWYHFSVHPHACGEHARRRQACPQYRGSPPRMWGTPQAASACHRVSRFTPTHVGNTRRLRSGDNIDSVHPHACGEHA